MLYSRFLDVHIGHLGNYDFENDIRAQMEREGGKLTHGGNWENYSPWAGGQDRDMNVGFGDGQLPSRGVIVVGVEVTDIENAAAMAGITSLIEWVNDTRHNGKIRFNVHGTETGGLTMKDGGGNWMETDAVNAGRWLVANGLEAVSGRRVTRQFGVGRGLTTVAFAICMGGRADLEAAKLNKTRTSTKAAPGSTIRKFGGYLRAQGITGVKVTGANEIVAGGRAGTRDAGTWGRSVDLPEGPGWERKMTGPKRSWIGRGILKVPGPFRILRSSGSIARGTISYPADCFVFFDRPTDGWSIERGGAEIGFIPDTGWITDTHSCTIKGPVGWFMKPKGRNKPGGEIRFTLKNTSVDLATGTYWQRLTRTPFKVVMVT